MVLNQSAAFQSLRSTILSVFMMYANHLVSSDSYWLQDSRVFHYEAGIKDTFIFSDHIRMPALLVNSEKSFLTQGGMATQLIAMRLDTLGMLATFSPRRVGNIIRLANQDTATPSRVVSHLLRMLELTMQAASVIT